VTFEPQNDLEAALADAAAEDAGFQAVAAALAAAELWIPQPPGEATGAASDADEGEEILLPLLEHEGRTYVPVFTSEHQFRIGAPEGMAAVRVPGSAVLASWPEEHGMAVNPGGEIGVAIAPEDVRALGRPTMSERRLSSGASVLLGEPAVPPTEVLDAVARACSEEGVVRSAYRALMTVEGEDDAEPDLVIGVELDPSVEPQPVLERLGRAAHGASGERVSFVLVDEARLSSIARFMVLETDPFYRRDR